MTTKALDVVQERLGKKIVYGNGNGLSEQQTVHKLVDEWNWNLNIFEIYDAIRDWDNQDQENVLTYAYHYFNRDKMIQELASFLGHYNLDD